MTGGRPCAAPVAWYLPLVAAVCFLCLPVPGVHPIGSLPGGQCDACGTTTLDLRRLIPDEQLELVKPIGVRCERCHHEFKVSPARLAREGVAEVRCEKRGCREMVRVG